MRIILSATALWLMLPLAAAAQTDAPASPEAGDDPAAMLPDASGLWDFIEEEAAEPDPDLPPDIRDPQRWSRVCSRAGCTVAARQVSLDEGRLLVSIAMTHGLEAENPALAVFTPLGVATRPGVRLVIDDDLPLPIAFDVCLPDGCRATIEPDAELFEAVVRARALTVQYFAFGRPAPLSFPLSMDGYADAQSHLLALWDAEEDAADAAEGAATTP